MNAFDYLVITVTALGAIYGLTRGVLRMATSLISLLAALYFASIYYPLAGNFSAQQFGLDPTIGSIIGYVAVFAIVFVSIEIIGRAVIRVTRVVHMGWVDRLAGSVLGAAVVAVAGGVMVTMLTVVLPVDAPFLRDSQLAPQLLTYNESLMSYVPAGLKDTYREKRDMLVTYWITHQPADSGSSAAEPTPPMTPSPEPPPAEN
jgi:membrane protein required for colicin V production